MRTADFLSAVSGYAPGLVAALLHSLWQAALLAAGCKVALLAVPFRRSNWRYGIALASLAMVVLLFLVTLRLETRLAQTPTSVPRAWMESAAAIPGEAATVDPAHPVPAPTPTMGWSTSAPPSRLPWQTVLGSLWLVGVLLMVLRAARILHGEARASGAGRPVGDLSILALLDELRVRLGVTRRVMIATVDAMCSPAVVGVVAPVILVPAALLTGSPPDHLRAILAHELAHIRRWDVLVNLLQLLVESLFFHNPCVWLLSAQVRHEREACCDAVAADCCGGAPAYARVLVDVGQTVLASGAAISFASPHGLSDRVRRLLGLRPTGETWRLLPLSVVLALMAGFASLLAVAQGAFKATDAVLSAKERIDLIEQTVERQKEEAAVGTTRYIGTVATPDGGLLPEGTTLTVYTTEPHSSTYAGLTVDRKTGRFQMSATGTTAMLWLRAPGYTPWFEGPMRPGPEPVTDTGLWVLEPQIPLVVRILDDKGEPIPDAKVTEHCNPTPNTPFPAGSSTTDAGGECIVPLIADYAVTIDVEAANFEPAKFADLYPDEQQPLVLRLRPSLPLVLQVTDRANDKPIPDATVRELQSDVPAGGMSHQHDEAPILGSSGPDGVCTVSGLHREGAYWLLVEAEGHGAELVACATPGEKVEVQLGPPRVLKGTITGDLGKLGKSHDRAQACVVYTIRRGDCGYQNTYTYAPIRVEDGVGTFEISTLYEGTFRVSAGGIEKAIKLGEGETDVQFQLSAKAEEGLPSREVRLVFEKRPDLPLPRGTMKVGHRDLSGRFYSSEDLPITDGVVSLHVPLGSDMEYSPDGMIGGWFAQGRLKSIAAGEDPLTVRIPYVPAGAISVSVVDKEGKPTDGFLADVREIEKSPHRTGPFLQVEGKSGSSPSDGIYAFTATPLPLEGTYEIVVHRSFTYVSTGPIQVTARHPLHQRQLVLEGSVMIAGQVVGPDGEPVANAPIGLELLLNGSSFGGSEIKTDDQGRFEFPGVVPHRGAKYTVRVIPERDFVQTRVAVQDLEQPVHIVLDRGLVVTGRIVNAADGSPVRDDKVRLLRDFDGTPAGPHQFYAEGLTGRDGSFRFSNLAPGTYRLCSDRARYDAENPAVTAGQQEPVVWRVPIGH